LYLIIESEFSFLIGWHLYDDDLQLSLEKNFKKKIFYFEITINSTEYMINLYKMTQEQKNNYLKLRRMRRATEAQIAQIALITSYRPVGAAVAQPNNLSTNTFAASTQNQVTPKVVPLVSGCSSDARKQSTDCSSQDEEQIEPPTKRTPVTGAAVQRKDAFVAKYLNKSIYTLEVTVKHALVLMVLIVAIIFRY
jgi:hypothetical protein